MDGVSYRSTKKTLYFESALYDICKQMAQDYYIKRCFNCQYSDYSPYGNDNYGCIHVSHFPLSDVECAVS